MLRSMTARLAACLGGTPGCSNATHSTLASRPPCRLYTSWATRRNDCDKVCRILCGSLKSEKSVLENSDDSGSVWGISNVIPVRMGFAKGVLRCNFIVVEARGPRYSFETEVGRF